MVKSIQILRAHQFVGPLLMDDPLGKYIWPRPKTEISQT